MFHKINLSLGVYSNQILTKRFRHIIKASKAINFPDCNEQKNGSYVTFEIGNKDISKQIDNHVSHFVNKVKIGGMDTKAFLQIGYLLRFYGNLNAAISGNIPEEHILSIRINSLRRLKNILHSLSKFSSLGFPESVSNTLKENVSRTLEGCCQKILYVALIKSHVKRATPKLLIIIESMPDPLHINLVKTKNLLPEFASTCIKLYDKNSIIKELSDDRWGLTELLLFSKHQIVLSSLEWEKISKVISSLHESRYFLHTVVDKIRLLSLDQSSDKSKIWQISAATCFGIVIKSLQNIKAEHDFLLEIENVKEAILATDWEKKKYDLQVRFLKLSDRLHSIFSVAFKCKQMSSADLQLNEWRKLSSFQNYLEDSSVVLRPMKKLEQRKNDIIHLPCSIEEDLRAFKDREMMASERDMVKRLQIMFGKPINLIKPENILCISKIGSHLCNLDTPDSDIDYFVIFRHSANLENDGVRSKERYYRKCKVNGYDLQAVEVRFFCQLLFYSSDVICDLLFVAYGHQYMHPVMNLLTKNSRILLSQRLLTSYMRLIRVWLQKINKNSLTGANNKLLYLIFHKMNMIEDINQGKIPQVRPSGKERDFILKLRFSPPLNKDEIGELVEQVNYKINKFSQLRQSSLPFYADHNSLREWLRTVRMTAH